ncbi:AAA domain-containing protein [Sodaliphilus sp.]|uniref:AAA domain-containing protein n=1 Tax=Sodaliphilus sp. TaxID=2815818 RepID=UPI00388FAF98
MFTEKDDRYAVIFKYDGFNLLEQCKDRMNTGTHRCIIIKKNDCLFVFIFENIELTASYDDDRHYFKIQECKYLNSLDCTTVEFSKVSHIDRTLEIAVKPEGWRYTNSNGTYVTMNLSEEINSLENYDAVIAELQRQEEIRKREQEENENAKKQLDVWTKYIQKERELLDSANKPFKLANSLPTIRKSSVDIETLPQITSIIEHEMTLEEFKNWQENDRNLIDAQINGLIRLKMAVRCSDFRNARAFGNDYDYARPFFRYSQFNRATSSIELEYLTNETDALFQFYERVNNSYRFINRVPVPLYRVIVFFSLQVTTTETDEERKKRIDILANHEFFSKPDGYGIRLGQLSKNGYDKKHLRIIFKDMNEDEISAAKDFFNNHTGSLIYPNLYKEQVLLNREYEALKKIEKPNLLQNSSLKDFIFNSSRAKATEEFIGLNSETIASTPKYIECLESQMLSLNPSQQEAVTKGLYAQDLCLLQGPPGTGKTTVISELIWQHIRKDQEVRIMLTSQTNLAIDNALNRLFSNSAIIEGSPSWRNMMLIKPLRKADTDKIEDEGAPFSEERIKNWINGQDESISSNNIVYTWMNHIVQRIEPNDLYSDILIEWKQALNNPDQSMRKLFAKQYIQNSNVLCMTCGRVNSKDFKDYEKGEGFDVVIVDEASKATLPELLMPLCYARKSIIIGDHRQLPPVIFENDFFEKIQAIDPELVAELDKQFRRELVEQSLFKRLIMHPFISPTIKATFNIQYRMHSHINDMVSQFYKNDSGGLTCGLDLRKIDIPDFSERDSRYHGLSLGRFIQPHVHTIWVDVPDGMELGGDGSSIYNEKEVEAVRLVIEALSKADGFDRYMNYWQKCKKTEVKITESKIGVISFYATQVQKIRRTLQSFCDRNEIKVSTKSVDKFQGQESGIVIVSTVRTKRLGFTRTPERLNVALSRARRLLIIVGNRDFYYSETARTNDGQYIYRNVIDTIKKNNGIIIDYRELKTLLGYEQ